MRRSTASSRLVQGHFLILFPVESRRRARLRCLDLLLFINPHLLPALFFYFTLLRFHINILAALICIRVLRVIVLLTGRDGGAILDVNH